MRGLRSLGAGLALSTAVACTPAELKVPGWEDTGGTKEDPTEINQGEGSTGPGESTPGSPDLTPPGALPFVCHESADLMEMIIAVSSNAAGIGHQITGCEYTDPDGPVGTNQEGCFAQEDFIQNQLDIAINQGAEWIADHTDLDVTVNVYAGNYTGEPHYDIEILDGNGHAVFTFIGAYNPPRNPWASSVVSVIIPQIDGRLSSTSTAWNVNPDAEILSSYLNGETVEFPSVDPSSTFNEMSGHVDTWRSEISPYNGTWEIPKLCLPYELGGEI